MPLTPAEAVKRVDEAVTVEMPVRRAKCCAGCHDVFLDSEENYRDPRNLGVAITETGRARFKELHIDDPVAHFKGKTIRVRGVVVLRDNRPNIEVSDPEQIEIVVDGIAV